MPGTTQKISTKGNVGFQEKEWQNSKKMIHLFATVHDFLKIMLLKDEKIAAVDNVLSATGTGI